MLSHPSRPRPATSTPSAIAELLQPRDGALYVVRWAKGRRQDAAHRYFRRRHDAEACAARLRSYGKSAAIFRSDTAWQEAGR